MTNFILTQLVALMSALSTPAPAAEMAADGPNASRDRDRSERLCHALECSDEQRARIKAIQEAHRDGIADERAEAKKIRVALKSERGSPGADAHTIAELREDLSALKLEIRKSRQDAQQEISRVLTPEQRERFVAIKAERKSERTAKKAAKHADKQSRKNKDRGKHKGKRRGLSRDDRRPDHADRARGHRADRRGKRHGKASGDWAKAERKGKRHGKAHVRGKGKRGAHGFATRGGPNGASFAG